jgi:hypothetical protein
MFDRTLRKLYELERRFEKAVENFPVEFRGWLYQAFRDVMYRQRRGSK